jgi:hypothetical protein
MIYCKSFFKFFCVCLSLEKLVNEKYFSIKKNCGLVFISIPFILGEKHFREVDKIKKYFVNY